MKNTKIKKTRLPAGEAGPRGLRQAGRHQGQEAHMRGTGLRLLRPGAQPERRQLEQAWQRHKAEDITAQGPGELLFQDYYLHFAKVVYCVLTCF